MGEIDKGVTLSLAQVLLHTDDKEKPSFHTEMCFGSNPIRKWPNHT